LGKECRITRGGCRPLSGPGSSVGRKGWARISFNSWALSRELLAQGTQAFGRDRCRIFAKGILVYTDQPPKKTVTINPFSFRDAISKKCRQAKNC